MDGPKVNVSRKNNLFWMEKGWIVKNSYDFRTKEFTEKFRMQQLENSPFFRYMSLQTSIVKKNVEYLPIRTNQNILS